MVRKLPQSRHSVPGKFLYGFSTGDTFFCRMYSAVAELVTLRALGSQTVAPKPALKLQTSRCLRFCGRSAICCTPWLAGAGIIPRPARHYRGGGHPRRDQGGVEAVPAARAFGGGR